MEAFFEIVTMTLVVAAGLAFGLYGLGWISTLKHRRLAVHPELPDLPPVSLLKPIKGEEEELADNLRALFSLDYPAPLEVIFSSTEDDDPGIEIAKSIALEFPKVPVKFVRADPSFGLNPKVSNLAGAIAAASYDLMLQSDANVRLPSDYLRKVVSELLGTDSSLLTSMVVGVGEETTGAAMENLQLSTFIAPGMCTALHVVGVNCVVGKSMLFRRSELFDVGGLEAVKDILCEDFILGQLYEADGKQVRLSATLVQNVNTRMGVRTFLGRHSRWLKMRVVIHIPAFIADLGSNPVALLSWAWVFSGFAGWVGALFAGAIVTKSLADRAMMRVVRGRALPWRHAWVSPVKDVLMGFVWIYAIFSRSVTWRGKKLRFGKNSLLRADDGTLPVRVLKRLSRAPNNVL